MPTEPTVVPAYDPNDPMVKMVAAFTTAMQAQGAATGDAVAAAMNAALPPRQLTPAQYDPKTTAHPNKHTAAKFTRPCYQNGLLLDWDVTTDEEIRLLNRITHSGWYVDGLVEVIIQKRGHDEAVHVNFKNRESSDKFAIAHQSGPEGFAGLLRKIVKAQEEEDLDEQTRPEPKRRPFGNSQATREARERAGVA